VTGVQTCALPISICYYSFQLCGQCELELKPFPFFSETNMLQTQDSDYWDSNKRTDAIFASFAGIEMRNPRLIELFDKWRTKRQRQISSIKDLLLCYYTDVRVVSIPAGGRPNLIHSQINTLYQEILLNTQEAREIKSDIRMSLTYQRLIPYLSYAFDHFSKEPESAFNFVKVAFRENPIPDDFGGGILQLLIAIKDYSTSKFTP